MVIFVLQVLFIDDSMVESFNDFVYFFIYDADRILL